MPENNPHLFAWKTEDMPELQHLILFLGHLPYQQIVAQLERLRKYSKTSLNIRFPNRYRRACSTAPSLTA